MGGWLVGHGEEEQEGDAFILDGLLFYTMGEKNGWRRLYLGTWLPRDFCIFRLVVM